MSVLVKFCWRTNVFGTTTVLEYVGSSFQQAFKLLLVPFASLDLDVQYSGIRLNLFQKVSMRFYNRCEFILDFGRLLKKL